MPRTSADFYTNVRNENGGKKLGMSLSLYAAASELDRKWREKNSECQFHYMQQRENWISKSS